MAAFYDELLADGDVPRALGAAQAAVRAHPYFCGLFIHVGI
jgi:hypothetical protein